MSHGLIFNNTTGTYSGNRVMVRNNPAWHQFATVYHAPIAARDANIDVGGDNIIVDKLPIQVNVPGFGLFTADSDYALVRRPYPEDNNPEIFGRVKDDYTPLSSTQFAEIVDMIIESSDFELDSYGALQRGMTFFASLRGKSTEVGGDEVLQYFNFSDTTNGKEALQISASPVRQVCMNTIRMAWGASKARIKVQHTRDVFQEAAWRMRVVSEMLNSGEGLVKALRRLVDVQITDDRMRDIVNTLYTYPAKPQSMELVASGIPELVVKGQNAEYAYTMACKRVNAAREDVILNFEYLNDTADQNAGNGWNAYNAITGYIDHQSGKNTDNGRRVMAMGSTLNDATDALRTKAYSLIMRG